jgi:DNA-binding NarL/FixJ family response regulator
MLGTFCESSRKWEKQRDRLRILIIDDSLVVRNGIRFLLSSCAECAVCGEAGDGAEGLLKAAELRPDAILLDVSMPGTSGLQIVPELRRALPQARILVMSADDLAVLLPHALGAGANGCVDKARLGTDLLPAIRRVCAP